MEAGSTARDQRSQEQTPTQFEITRSQGRFYWQPLLHDWSSTFKLNLTDSGLILAGIYASGERRQNETAKKKSTKPQNPGRTWSAHIGIFGARRRSILRGPLF